MSFPKTECADSYQQLVLGSPFQHKNQEEQTIFPVWHNVTKVPNPLNGQPPVTPYARPHNNGIGVSCWPDYTCGDGTNGEPFCELPEPEGILECSEGENYSKVQQGRYHNCYELSQDTIDYSKCTRIGFKNIFARKAWHGRHGFTSRTIGQADTFGYCCSCGFHNQDAEPDETKYRTVEVTATYSEDRWEYNELEEYVLVTYTGSGSASTSINRLSGGATETFSVSVSPEAEDIEASIAALLLLANSFSDTVIAEYCHDFDPNYYPAPTRHSTGFGNEHWGEWDDEQSRLIARSVVTPTTYERNTWADVIEPGEQDPVFKQVTHEKYTYTATTLEYEYWNINTATATGGGGGTAATVSVTLADSYSSQQVNDDLNKLLAKWQLNDDRLYPWRTDTYTNKGPLLSYDELLGYPTIQNRNQEPDPTYTGLVLGEPLPLGYESFWNPKHANWDTCISPYCGGTVHFVTSYGALSPEYIPAATQWIDDYEALDMPQGAFLGFEYRWTRPSCTESGRSRDGYLWGCKWAETKIPKPAFNFARPCGKDRYTLIPSSSRCVSAVSENTLTLQTAAPADFLTDDLAYVCGVAGITAGIYKVTKLSDTQFTLAELKVTAEQIGDPLVEDCGTGILVKLKWKQGIPAICSKLKVLSTSTTAPVTVVTKGKHYLFNGDQVLATTTGGNTSLFTVTVVSSKSIILQEATPGNKYTYLKSPLAAAEVWDTEAMQGTYVYKEWEFNFRDVAEYNRIYTAAQTLANSYDCDYLTACPVPTVPANPRENAATCGLDQNCKSVKAETHCLNFTACSPIVMCISPNGEVWPNGKTFPFPEHLKLDSQYSSYWAAIIQQHIADPFYTAIPCPCVATENGYECDCEIEQDDGTCKEDELEPCKKYYAHTPYYEARAEQPEGAPEPQFNLGCLTVEQLDVETCPDKGNVCNAPAIGQGTYLPWSIYLNQLTCVCDNGRFADKYIVNNITCDLQEEETGI